MECDSAADKRAAESRQPGQLHLFHLHCERRDQSEAGIRLIPPPSGVRTTPQSCTSLLNTVRKVTVLPDGKTTQVDLTSSIAKGATAPTPPKTGTVSLITSKTLLASVVTQILQYNWDNERLWFF